MGVHATFVQLRTEQTSRLEGDPSESNFEQMGVSYLNRKQCFLFFTTINHRTRNEKRENQMAERLKTAALYTSRLKSRDSTTQIIQEPSSLID